MRFPERFFSVPYSEGFSAVVNGKKVKIEKVDYGLSGIPASKGKNNIEVSYETPGIKTGAIISLSGVSVMIVYLIINLIISKKKKTKAEK